MICTSVVGLSIAMYGYFDFDCGCGKYFCVLSLFFQRIAMRCYGWVCVFHYWIIGKHFFSTHCNALLRLGSCRLRF